MTVLLRAAMRQRDDSRAISVSVGDLGKGSIRGLMVFVVILSPSLSGVGP